MTEKPDEKLDLESRAETPTWAEVAKDVGNQYLSPLIRGYNKLHNSIAGIPNTSKKGITRLIHSEPIFYILAVYHLPTAKRKIDVKTEQLIETQANAYNKYPGHFPKELPAKWYHDNAYNTVGLASGINYLGTLFTLASAQWDTLAHLGPTTDDITKVAVANLAAILMGNCISKVHEEFRKSREKLIRERKQYLMKKDKK